jgi:prephenate dehydrogenase
VNPDSRIAVVGVGLIGGSFALAIKRARPKARIIGLDCNPAALTQARSRGAIDDATEDFSAVADCDAVFVATPVLSCEKAFAACAPHLRADALLFDGGSVKGEIVKAAKRVFSNDGDTAARFVGCHPVAGAEFSGVAAARADLFADRTVIICPGDAAADAIAAAKSLWQDCGARIAEMDCAAHDRIFGVVSHLPHALAFALVRAVGRAEHAEILLQFAAGGFRDFTRIASSDPEMWRDIFLANRKNIIAALDDFAAHTAVLRTLAADGDGEALREYFAFARDLRNSWLKTLEK